ncbi:MAG: phosphoenolpyruvate carboxylase [Atopobiaceae bacterium]|nr:phosphoenolpyruvate carboxylase [Atopobiaceae bacterium]MCI2174038.1 phosphoenolpyruvate carboxylase [Atopobiaceae bacterium]MCI2207872.1 phosphoenolpyruvate carboxylase [Atopobiaceae bacterium]
MREAVRAARERARADAAKTFSGMKVPESLRDNMELLLRLLREVLTEYDPKLRDSFDELLADLISADERGVVSAAGASSEDESFEAAVALIDGLDLEQQTVLTRALTTYFHLANLAEENYRVETLHEREKAISLDSDVDTSNELVVGYHRLVEEAGPDRAAELLGQLEFHPVFTAHPTEARRKAVEGKIRRLGRLLEEHPRLGGSDLAENERHMLQEIDALLRTSPTALKKPTPVEEADTIIDIFDNTLFDTIPQVYRRFDDWALGEDAGRVPPVCPAFFHPGSWIGSDRDGNPNVTAKVSRAVAVKYFTHMVGTLCDKCRRIGRNLTLDATRTKPSDELVNLWNHQVEMSEVLTDRASLISESEPHRAVMLVMADRLAATITRNTDTMYRDADEFLGDLRIVQSSLAQAGAERAAYGPVQTLIWQVETFGFHMVEMEFRQHSLVHSRALADIHEHGRNGERGALDPKTHECLDTFRALGSIQKRYGIKMARRYIISFTKSAQNVADVYELSRLAFAHPEDVPTIDVIPLFEQLEDLEGCVDVLDDMLKLPDVQRRLSETGRKMEVMLGYSDSSKDAGPTTATLALHSAQERIAQWADRNDIDLTLMHGRGGAVGRGGGPANKAVLAQPKGSVNCRFKLTEQGEVIFARYGNPVLAQRHLESVAGATLEQSAPSIEKLNTDMTLRYAGMASSLEKASHARYLDLLNTPDFASWFSTVTPLTEIGLLPIGSRPAKRGLGATSLDDLRTIPWVFSWSQARINLAAWYGLGTACEKLDDIDLLRRAYAEWPLFTTFIDNIEMSIAKTDGRIARMYLSLGDRDDLSKKVLDEMALTRKWTLAIVGDEWPLQHRRVLGQAVRLRNPYVDALSLSQVHALAEVRRHQDELAASGREDEDMDAATLKERDMGIKLILSTVAGVSAGLQNTG